MSQPAFDHRDSTVDDIVEGILGSYRELGGINHIAGATLPSRQSVERIVHDLESLVFPGFKAEESVAEEDVRYITGERVVRVSRALAVEVEKSIQYACRVRRDCQRHEDCRGEAEEIVRGLMEQIPEIRRRVNLDVHAAFRGDPAARSHEEVILSYPGVEAILIHRIAHELWVRDVAMIPRMMSEYIHGVTGIDIHPGATIGDSFFIDHGTGVVVGETTVIGASVKLYQGVTLGALSVQKELANKKRHPTIEDEVTIYAGATILGGRTVVGRGSIIGGNVWLVESVPANSRIYHNPSQVRQARADDPEAWDGGL
ncbi:MAG TPA: serine O-acetyltransferase EpsC [Spirochaetia bacterium]|nr:serine O-acetyltransferase EpsC [Spirochaetia bacterium]